jgi:hypothetical protein
MGQRAGDICWKMVRILPPDISMSLKLNNLIEVEKISSLFPFISFLSHRTSTHFILSLDWQYQFYYGTLTHTFQILILLYEIHIILCVKVSEEKERHKNWSMAKSFYLLYIRTSGFHSFEGVIRKSLTPPWSLTFHCRLWSIHSCENLQYLLVCVDRRR